jgi:hypothetical protein
MMENGTPELVSGINFSEEAKQFLNAKLIV